MQDLRVIENMCKVATLKIIKREAVLTRILQGFPTDLESHYVKRKLFLEKKLTRCWTIRLLIFKQILWYVVRKLSLVH